MNSNDAYQIAQGGLWQGQRLIFEQLPSTNRWALENADKLRHGDVIWAKKQTAGRGRFDREWSSPGKNLTASFCIDLQKNTEPCPLLTAAAALAVRSVAAATGAPAAVKWPNDVICGNGKLAGILAEQDDSKPDRIILGIGFNLSFSTPPQVAQGHLAPVSLEQASGKDCIPELILSQLCVELEQRLPLTYRQTEKHFEEWRRYDCLTGQRITLHGLDQTICGDYAGINQSGQIGIIDEQGKVRYFWSGDVSVRLNEDCRKFYKEYDNLWS